MTVPITSVNHQSQDIIPEPPSLSQRMYQKLISAHHSEIPFDSKLKSGEVSEKEYVNYLSSIRVIYCALEKSLFEAERFESMNLFYIPEIFRSEKLIKDIDQFPGVNITPLSSMMNYRERLRELSTENPYGLVAHFYVLYTRNLFRVHSFKEAIGNKWSHVVNFFDYSELETQYGLQNAKEFVPQIIDRIDQLELSSDQAQFLIDEVVHAYDLYVSMLDELNNISSELSSNKPNFDVLGGHIKV